MKSFAVLLVSFAAVSCAPQFFRAPAHDSAIIRSDRLGGNFAYSVQEGHAYQAIAPVVENVRTPVAVSYSHPGLVHAPAQVVAYQAPKVEVEAPVEVKAAPEPVQVQYTAPAPVELKYVSPVEVKYAAPAQVFYEAPKYEVKEVKPIEVTYTAPEVKYVSAPAAPVHHVVYEVPTVKAAPIPAKPLVYYDAPTVEVTETKPVEYRFVAPYAQPSYAHAVAW